MRRGTGRGSSRSRGTSYNRGSSYANRPRSQGQPAPMSTSQGLQDIDLELELLKRKREIIEKQQQMLTTNLRQINTFDQPRFNEPHDRYNRSFESYNNSYDSSYDNSYGNSQNFGGRSGSTNRKRPIPVWDHESPPKRFSAPSSRGMKAFGSRVGPPPNNPRSAHNQPAKSFNRPNPAPSQKKNFKPTKVTKTYAAPKPLMKLNTYHPAERKRLVTEASHLTTAVASSKTAPANDDEWILRSDQEPNRKIVGRLELVLGEVMKKIKRDHPEHQDLFNNAASVRAMKQILRERIRLAMIGKSTFNIDYIQTMYVNTYPQTTTIDIIMKGLEARKKVKILHIKSDTPETYFKCNMTRLMTLKLEQMFSKIEEVYGVFTPSYIKPRLSKSQRQLVNSKTKQGTEQSQDVANIESEKPQENITHIECGKSQDNVDSEKSQDNAEDLQPVPENVNQCQVKIENLNDDVIVDTKAEVKIDVDKPQVATANVAPATSGQPKSHLTEDEIIKSPMYKVYDQFLNTKLSQLLKKYIPKIVQLMEMDKTYDRFESAVREETKRMIQGTSTGSVDHLGRKGVIIRRTFAPKPYNVKLMSKPCLPKRKLMEKFFEPFNPSTIKKHRSVHNLLFVGFDDKKSYENILAATGTIIGKNKLDIMPYQYKMYNNQETGNNAQVPQSELKTDFTEDPFIAPDIDEQITDLLTSIRKAEADDRKSDDVVIKDKKGTAVENNKDAKEIKQTIEIGDDNENDEVTEIKNDDIEIIEENNAHMNQDNPLEINEDNPIEINEDNPIEINEDYSIEIYEDKPTKTNEDNPVINDETLNLIEETNEEIENGNLQVKVTPTKDKNGKIDKIQENVEQLKKKDSVGSLKEKNEVKLTPTRSSARASARLATPSNIKTRRRSMMQ